MNFIAPLDSSVTGHAHYIYDNFNEIVAVDTTLTNIQLVGTVGSKLLAIAKWEELFICAEIEPDVWSYWTCETSGTDLSRFPEFVKIRSRTVQWRPSRRYKDIPYAYYTRYI